MTVSKERILVIGAGMAGGRIVASGGPELALELEEKGYDQYTQVAA